MKSVDSAAVAIVGCGPVGMVLAGLLGRRGIDVVLIDRSLEVFPLPRAAHIDHTAVRVLQELGCAREILAQTIPNKALVLADENLDPLVTMTATGIGRSGYPASMYFYQPTFDRTLEKVVRALPNVRVERGVELVSYDDHDGGVTLSCRSVFGGGDTTIEANWLVGCDGSSSLVRELAGIELESLDFDEQWLVLDLNLEESLADTPDFALQVCNPGRPWVANPVPGGRFRIEMELQEADDVREIGAPAFLREFLHPLFGETDFSIERDAVYTFHGLLANAWKRGRVLLAGDAAHQMPPFLGQGMCSGIRDAANLAWKLAGVLEGAYPEGILTTYESERRPHVESVISSAIEVGRFISDSDPVRVEARNGALRAGEISSIPTFSIPRLLPGALIGPGGGAQFPQPVNPNSDIPTLDERLGKQVCILSRFALEEDDLAWWARTWGAMHVRLDDLGDDMLEVSGWLAARETTIAVIRPDRYLMAAGNDFAEITRAFRH